MPSLLLASPTCLVNSTATTNGVNVTPTNLVTISLASTVGVKTWSLRCIGTDETSTASAINASLVINYTTKVATLLAPSSGRALIFESKVNGGVTQNETSDSRLTTTFGVYTLTAGSHRVLALNERFEGNSTFGWIATINPLLRIGSVADPTLTSSSPNVGFHLASGYSITLTGTGFLASPTVTIGGVACTSVVMVDSTTITCVTPTLPSRAFYDITVTNASSGSDTLTDGWLALPATRDVRADAIVMDADATHVQQWTDRSGSGNHYTQFATGQGALVAAASIGGRTSLLMGTNAVTYLQQTSFTGPSGAECFIVKKNGSAVDGFPWIVGTGAQSYHPYIADGQVYESWATTDRKTAPAGGTTFTNGHVCNILSFANFWSIAFNGAAPTYTTMTNTVAWGSTQVIGTSGIGAFINPIYIGQYVVFPFSLTTDERTRVNAHLIAYWSIV